MSTWLVQDLGCLQLIPAFHEHLAGAVPGVPVADSQHFMGTWLVQYLSYL